MVRRTRLTRPRRVALTALLGVLVLAAATAQPLRRPEPGVLLVASETMADPRFNRAVVLLVEHDQSGSWGLIINKPTQVSVSEAAPSLEGPDGDAPVYFGGPVQIDRLRILYRDEGAGEAGATGLPGVRWSDSAKELGRRLADDSAGVRVYAGYAGWAPGQLAFELAHGGWRMIEGRPRDVFGDESERLWRRLSQALDGIAI